MLRGVLVCIVALAGCAQPATPPADVPEVAWKPLDCEPVPDARPSGTAPFAGPLAGPAEDAVRRVLDAVGDALAGTPEYTWSNGSAGGPRWHQDLVWPTDRGEVRYRMTWREEATVEYSRAWDQEPLPVDEAMARPIVDAILGAASVRFERSETTLDHVLAFAEPDNSTWRGHTGSFRWYQHGSFENGSRNPIWDHHSWLEVDVARVAERTPRLDEEAVAGVARDFLVCHASGGHNVTFGSVLRMDETWGPFESRVYEVAAQVYYDPPKPAGHCGAWDEDEVWRLVVDAQTGVVYDAKGSPCY